MVFFIFIQFLKITSVCKSGESDQTPRFAKSGLVLHCLPMSHKKDARLISQLVVNPFLSLAFFLWDIGKQWRPRPDAALCGAWSGSPLFAFRIAYQNLNKDET